jgi:hypothetical protein
MTEKEHDVKCAELNLRSAELRAKECKVDMEEGYKRLAAKMAMQYESLKAAYAQSLLDLEEAQLNLTQTKQSAEKNFD